MKDRLVTYLSLVVSIAALGYATWVHRHSQEMARQALKHREAELVRGFAPHVRDLFKDVLGKTNALPGDPTTVEELMSAWSTVMRGVTETSLPDEKAK